MVKFKIHGMSCVACVARVEKAVKNLGNVNEVNVNLLTESMTIGNMEGCSAIDIINAVKNAGYDATIDNGISPLKSKEPYFNKTKYQLKHQFFASLIILLPLLYLSMGSLLNLPNIFAHSFHNEFSMFVLSLTIIIINHNFFTRGFYSLWKFSPNMDSLIALGASSAFIYSSITLFAPQITNTSHYYFESAAMILTLICLGKLLESYSKEKTTNALHELYELIPDTAVILKNGNEETIPVDNLKLGDTFIIKSGNRIPTDGIVISGSALMDESCITGEFLPASKKTGSVVNSATSCLTGFVHCKVTQLPQESSFSKIIELVKNTSASKAPISKFADKVCFYFVPTVIAIALISMLVWLSLGFSFNEALSAFIAVLVISCPCALGLATPVSILVGTGISAKHGILYKNAATLELAGKIDCVVFDKTGTLTEGKTAISSIKNFSNHSIHTIMNFALSLESKSEHPLGLAIINKAKENNAQQLDVSDFKVHPGLGISGNIEKQCVLCGSYDFIKANLEDKQSIKEYQQENIFETNVYLSINKQLAAIFTITDHIRPTSSETIEALRKLKIKTIMLTGAQLKSTKEITNYLKFDKVITNVLPNQKVEQIKELQKLYKVAMIGDGINDAAALTQADLGIAIGSGSNIAIDSADIVLAHNDPMGVVHAYQISKAVIKNIHQNLFWAFLYNILGIPLATGFLYPLFGWQLNPIFAACAMSFSSICVITNALRLKLIDKNIFLACSSNSTKEINLIHTEKFNMQKTIYIQGMMCKHCEAHVLKALSELNDVNVISVDHESGMAVIELSAPVADSLIFNQISKLDYKVTKIENK